MVHKMKMPSTPFCLECVDSRRVFGILHLFSVLMSFLSVFLGSLSFNDFESGTIDNCHDDFDQVLICSKPNLSRLCISAPFFLSTLVFRALGLAVLISITRFWGGTVICWYKMFCADQRIAQI